MASETHAQKAMLPKHTYFTVKYLSLINSKKKKKKNVAKNLLSCVNNWGYSSFVKNAHFFCVLTIKLKKKKM